MEHYNNQHQIHSTNVLAYADRYQSKFAWDKGHREKGYYLPDLTTYKWTWGIKLSLKNKLPKRDNVKTVQKKIVKASRDECVDIINEKDPELQVDTIMSWQFLADLAYTLDPNNPVFAPNRIKSKFRLDVQQARSQLNSQMFNVPSDLLQGENPRTSRRPKRNTCWSIVSSIINPRLVSAIKSRNNAISTRIVSFQLKGMNQINESDVFQNQQQIQEQEIMIRQFKYFHDRLSQGSEKLRVCLICQCSFPHPMFTQCCSIVMHKTCYERMGVNPRCPNCAKIGFNLTHIPEFCDRVFEEIEMEMD